MGRAKVAWNEVCQPKAAYGLGNHEVYLASIYPCWLSVDCLSQNSSIYPCWLHDSLLYCKSYPIYLPATSFYKTKGKNINNIICSFLSNWNGDKNN